MKIKEKLKEKLNKHDFTRKLLDYDFRTVVFTVGALVITTGYAVFYVFLGISYISVWYLMLAVYYLMLAAMRTTVVFYHKGKHKRYETEYGAKLSRAKIYKSCGIIIALLTLPLSIAILLIVSEHATFSKAGLMIYVSAIYTTYKVVATIRNMLKARKVEDLTILTVRSINLADMFVSILALQTAMFYSFSTGEENTGVMNAVTGAAVCLATVIIGAFMIANGSLAIKKIKYEEHLSSDNITKNQEEKSMNAIEIKNLSKSFRGMYAVDNLNMTVPVGAIYGFIGENGSGKSTTEKLICGHLVPDGGEIKLFGKSGNDAGVRARVGALIENAGCFPNSSVWANLMMQALNLGIENRAEEINRVLKIVRMEDSAHIKFKSCSLGMKQRIGIAMALLGNPALLILDEPINGLDTDGCRIMREILLDITQNLGCTVLISSHILGELEKIATHYGIIRQGKMIQELSAAEMDARSRVFVTVNTKDNAIAAKLLQKKFETVKQTDDGILVYDVNDTESIVKYLLENKQAVSEIKKNKVGLEEYYIELMNKKEGV